MLCMLGYHGEVAWCRGAFLALSQFFTLSGFLITGVLLRNHLQPGGELKSFWSRRVRRLMPAAILALVGHRHLRRHGRHPPAGGRAARRRLRGGHLDRELALHPERPVLPEPLRGAVTGPALLVAGDRGAVLPRPPGRADLPGPADALAAGPARRPRHRRAALDRVDGRAVPRRREPRPALLRHRHPDGRAPRRRGAGRRPVPDRRRVLRADPADPRGGRPGLLRRDPLVLVEHLARGRADLARRVPRVLVPVVRRDPRRARRQGAAHDDPVVAAARLHRPHLLRRVPLPLARVPLARPGADRSRRLGTAEPAPRGHVRTGDPVVPLRRAADHARPHVRAGRPGPRPGGAVARWRRSWCSRSSR